MPTQIEERIEPHPTPEGPPLDFPLRVASVDVGSNAIRFLAAEFSDAERWTELAYERVPVRLGHSTFLTGELTGSAMDRAVEGFRGFARQIERFGIRHVRAVATSAVRESRNGHELVRRIREASGIELRLISGSEEARLVWHAVRSRIDFGDAKWMLVDLGGGSVEVSLADRVGIMWSESHTMGSVRLLEELSGADDAPAHFANLLAEYASTLRIPHASKHWTPVQVIATGGNIETLARLAGEPLDGAAGAEEPGGDRPADEPGGDRPADEGSSGEEATGAIRPAAGVEPGSDPPSDRSPRETTVYRITRGRLGAAIDELARLSYSQRMGRLGLREDRADVILPAAIVYDRVAELAGADELLVPCVGVKEGVLLDLVDELMSGAGLDRAERVAYEGAVSLGRRYLFDEEHARHVAGLAASLFDQLAWLHELRASDRRILIAGSLLHDIGQHISYSKHHKHSLYLILHSEIPGISPDELPLVALVARYHRRAEPKGEHYLFADMGPEDRRRVERMSAILRVADSLDREHLQRVHSVEARAHEDRLELHLEKEGRLLLEQWALRKKGRLFARIFGLEPYVTFELADEDRPTRG